MDLDRLEDYNEWLVKERQRTHSIGVALVQFAIAVTKWKRPVRFNGAIGPIFP
jgi:hypothetical protein